jgi:hypothetical protein
MLLLIATLRKYWPEALIGVVVMAVAVWWAACRPKPAPVPVAEAASLDSLNILRPAYLASIETLTVRETAYVAVARHEVAGATIARTQGDSLAQRADSLQRTMAAQRDTVSSWRQVAMTWHAAADLLRASNDSLRAAHAADTLALAASDARALASEARLAATEGLNQRLAKDIAGAGQCHVLPFVSCPSRRVAFVVGGLLSAAGTVYLLRR